MELGKEVKMDFKFEGDKVILSAMYDGKGVDSTISVMVEVDYFLDKLAEAIPGKLDDMVLAGFKGALVK